MPTLIAVYNSEGCVGRCDAKCYEASEPDCECICGGANHGKGLQKAQANTEALAGQWIEKHDRDNPDERFTYQIGENQPDLFSRMGLELL